MCMHDSASFNFNVVFSKTVKLETTLIPCTCTAFDTGYTYIMGWGWRCIHGAEMVVTSCQIDLARAQDQEVTHHVIHHVV